MAVKRKYLPGDPNAPEETEILEGEVLDPVQGSASLGHERDEDIIEGEILSETREYAGSRQRAPRSRSGPSMKQRFEGAREKRQEERFEKAFQDDVRRKGARERRRHWGYQEPPARQPRPVPTFIPALERDAAQGLMASIAKAENQYMQGLAQSKLFSKEQEGSAAGEMNRQHKKYVTMMMFSAIQPLGNGMSAVNIARTIGLGAMMWKLSPDFRNMVGEGIGAVKDSLGDVAEKWVAGKAAKYDESGKPRLIGRDKADVWQSRLDRIRKMRDGDRLPFTAHSAGMAEVALGDRAYAQMRQPGANIDQIMADHETAVEKLYQMADYDGLSADEVSKCARIVVGQRIMVDPTVASRYNELARGDFVMAPEKMTIDPETGEATKYWDGAFEHTSGAVINGGTFGVRAPQSRDEHADEIYRTIYLDMAASADNVDELHSKMMTYGLGWAGMPSDDLIAKIDRDNPGRHRFQNAMSMMQSMADDGIVDEEARFAYSDAFMSALDLVQDQFPQVAIQWEAKYKSRWRETMASMVDDPGKVRSFWERADQRSRGEERSQAGPRGTYSTRDQQSSQSYAEARTGRSYPAPGDTRTSPTPSSTDGWSGSAPSNQVAPETRVDVSEMARRNEVAKRNQRANQQAHNAVGMALGQEVELAGAGVDSDIDEPQP
jgi:hypothetical protein